MASPCKSTNPAAASPWHRRTDSARRQSGRCRPDRRRARTLAGPFAGGGGGRTAPKIRPRQQRHRGRGPRARAVPQRAGQAHHRKPARLHPHQPAEKYDSLDQFLQAWQQADRKAALLQEWKAGRSAGGLADEVAHMGTSTRSICCCMAYDQPPLTRRERAAVQKRNVFTQYGPVARKGARRPARQIRRRRHRHHRETKSSKSSLHRPGRPVELVRSFGGRPQYLNAGNPHRSSTCIPICPNIKVTMKEILNKPPSRKQAQAWAPCAGDAWVKPDRRGFDKRRQHACRLRRQQRWWPEIFKRALQRRLRWAAMDAKAAAKHWHARRCHCSPSQINPPAHTCLVITGRVAPQPG